MQAFAPVLGFRLLGDQTRNRFRMAADFQAFSSDSPFSPLPSTGETTPCNTSSAATHM